ncbi:hypothetical protein P3S67_001959 [Capsicum chacoense]
MLIGGAKGSKILLTTCSDMVAEVSGSVHQHKLGAFLEEEPWTLFEKITFECNREHGDLNLVERGKEILRECRGVPLAIRLVGILLRLKRTGDEWMYFKNQDSSSITRGGNKVMAILRLSYNYLLRYLKICFAYCSFFPKDFKIQRFYLVDMWIAQGFIKPISCNKDKLEDVANSYFMYLLRRSFFQEHESFMQFYKMHDLIHDLAKEVADGELFSIIKAEDTKIVPDQTLHASCLFEIDGSSTFPNSFYRKHLKLRTFIYLNDSSFNFRENDFKFFPFERSISTSPADKIYASIFTLPNTITKLHNLQVQKLDRCYELEKLPRDIWRLMSLRRLVCQGYCSLTHILPGLSQLTSLMHLDFDGCSSLEDMPAGQLTSLRMLPSFIIGKESCISGQASDTWNELKGLVDLRNSLSIKFLGHVRAIGERTLIGVVKRMKHLRQLSVEFEYANQDDVGSPAASQKH